MSKDLKKIEYLIAFIVFMLFVVLLDKFILSSIDTGAIMDKTSTLINELTPESQVICSDGKILISVKGGDLCREDIAYDGSEKDIYLKIFDTYPKFGDGKEFIYDFLDEGDIATADNYLKNKIDIERYQPVEIEKLSWDEDPYGERYWKFLFYSLRETRHLLYAYRTTGDVRYVNKLSEIVDSFVVDGINKPLAWDDYHAVAFRAMVLTNTWWKLREENVLTVELSEKILKAIERHGEFLLDEAHYEKKYNHGLNEAIALLLLGVNFPTLDKSGNWLEVGNERIAEGFDLLLDDDGVLIENSPYYHIYVLEKYWGLKHYFIKNKIAFDNRLFDKLDKMIAYSTYILEPDLQVPLLGASLQRQVGNQKAFRDISDAYPQFEYVLTQGKEGKMPEDLNKYYENTGQVILRSGFGKKTKFENEFEEQTQVIFDVGAYRTDHSDLDALSFNLYSNGKNLLPDSGLYTYENEDKLKDYFHGTRGHNTVLVDGQNQRRGRPLAGELNEGDGYAYYTAQHNLYPQTFHQRGMMLSGHDTVVIVDRLISNKEHDYEQLFHLAPGLIGEIDKSSVVVKNENQGIEFVIRQILNDGLEFKLGDMENDPDNNLCSLEYKKTIPCQTISFKKHAQNMDLVTVIEIGDSYKKTVIDNPNHNTVLIRSDNHSYSINIDSFDGRFFAQSQKMDKIVSSHQLDLVKAENGWQLAGEGSENYIVGRSAEGKVEFFPKEIKDLSIDPERPSFEIEIDGLGDYHSVNQKIESDIPWDADDSRIKIYEQEDYMPILGYHNVVPDEQEIITQTLEMHATDFDKQIDYMTNVIGCRWFKFGDLMENYVLKGIKIPKKACIITFDDGRENNHLNVFPILKKHNAVATFYVITERVFGENSSYMHFSELDELLRDGNEIGSHTVNHIGLTTGGLTESEIEYQFDESLKKLNSQGYDVKTIAYPKGEQNDKVIESAKKYYLAGRDTEKDNQWRGGRPATVGFDSNYIWLMNYYKPEMDSPEALGKAMAYDGFWQFEEGYRIDSDIDEDIATLSSHIPTDSSYAVVGLQDAGDKISNKFIVAQDGNYTIEAYGSVNELLSYDFPRREAINVYVDGNKAPVYQNKNEECRVHNNQYYCFYNANIDLSLGAHVLSVESNLKNIKLDKFRMYRDVSVKNEYKMIISEHKNMIPKAYPESLNIEVVKKTPFKNMLVFSGLFLLLMVPLSYYSIINFNKKR